MSFTLNINEKIFIISGGASGLGAKYVGAFLKEGAKHIAIFDIKEDMGVATVERYNSIYPGKVTFFKCDISDEYSVTNAFKQAVEKYQRIDVIINNAGIMSDAPASWRKSCEVNWLGLVSLTMKGIAHMRKDESGNGGTIVNIASAAGLAIYRHLPIYSASKLAVIHFSQCLAAEPFHEKTGIRILTMCFGATKTSLMENLDQLTYDKDLGKELCKVTDDPSNVQKVESAVTAVVKVFKTGDNGTIWAALFDKPAKNVTSLYNNAFSEFEEEIFDQH